MQDLDYKLTLFKSGTGFVKGRGEDYYLSCRPADKGSGRAWLMLGRVCEMEVTFFPNFLAKFSLEDQAEDVHTALAFLMEVRD